MDNFLSLFFLMAKDKAKASFILCPIKYVQRWVYFSLHEIERKIIEIEQENVREIDYLAWVKI